MLRRITKVTPCERTKKNEPNPGLEPGTYSLRMNCSTN